MKEFPLRISTKKQDLEQLIKKQADQIVFSRHLLPYSESDSDTKKSHIWNTEILEVGEPSLYRFSYSIESNNNKLKITRLYIDEKSSTAYPILPELAPKISPLEISKKNDLQTKLMRFQYERFFKELIPENNFEIVRTYEPETKTDCLYFQDIAVPIKARRTWGSLWNLHYKDRPMKEYDGAVLIDGYFGNILKAQDFSKKDIMDLEKRALVGIGGAAALSVGAITILYGCSKGFGPGALGVVLSPFVAFATYLGAYGIALSSNYLSKTLK